MDLSNLTAEEAWKILAAVEPMMSYTSALTRRRQSTGWKPPDSFYVHAYQAHDALHAMRMLAHYAVWLSWRCCSSCNCHRAAASNRSIAAGCIAEKVPRCLDRPNQGFGNAGVGFRGNVRYE